MIEAGRKLPPQYYEQPDEPRLAEHLVGVWNEFFDLSTERQIGMSVGPIPASKIRERARELVDDDEEASRFYILIRRLDDAYLADRAPKSEDENLAVAPGDVPGTKKLLKNVSARSKTLRQNKKP